MYWYIAVGLTSTGMSCHDLYSRTQVVIPVPSVLPVHMRSTSPNTVEHVHTWYAPVPHLPVRYAENEGYILCNPSHFLLAPTKHRVHAEGFTARHAHSTGYPFVPRSTPQPQSKCMCLYRVQLMNPLGVRYRVPEPLKHVHSKHDKERWLRTPPSLHANTRTFFKRRASVPEALGGYMYGHVTFLEKRFTIFARASLKPCSVSRLSHLYF